jgi:hypothetical protein
VQTADAWTVVPDLVEVAGCGWPMKVSEAVIQRIPLSGHSRLIGLLEECSTLARHDCLQHVAVENEGGAYILRAISSVRIT